MNAADRPAVLLVHGILGKPDHFDRFRPLIPSDWTVRSILLEGHGGTAEDLSRASMNGWKAQVHEALEELRKEHSRIFILAHSMGTLFAIQEAVQQPVEALFLLNVPLKVHVTGSLIETVWKVYRGKIRQDDEWALAARDSCSIRIDPNPLKYIGWIPRYLELFAEIRRTGKMIGKLSVPAYACFSLQDEMVSMRSVELLQGNPFVTIRILNSSGHFYYSKEDEALLLEDFRKQAGNGGREPI